MPVDKITAVWLIRHGDVAPLDPELVTRTANGFFSFLLCMTDNMVRWLQSLGDEGFQQAFLFGNRVKVLHLALSCLKSQPQFQPRPRTSSHGQMSFATVQNLPPFRPPRASRMHALRKPTFSLAFMFISD